MNTKNLMLKKSHVKQKTVFTNFNIISLISISGLSSLAIATAIHGPCFLKCLVGIGIH